MRKLIVIAGAAAAFLLPAPAAFADHGPDVTAAVDADVDVDLDLDLVVALLLGLC